MGRPLNSRYFGPTVDDSGDMVSEENISVIAKIGTNPVSYEAVIIKQSSESDYVVNDSPDGEGNQGTCKLVDKTIPEDDEMVIVGNVYDTGDSVNIRKINNRTLIDFENNRYTWEIDDDSSVNILVLHQI